MGTSRGEANMLKNSPIILFRTALSTLQLFPPSTQLFSPQYPIIPVIIKILIDIFDHIVLVCQATHTYTQLHGHNGQ